MNDSFLSKNLASLPSAVSEWIQTENSMVEGKDYKRVLSKTGEETLVIDGVWIHSQFDPKKEAFRFVSELPHDGTERIYLLFGAGIGYIIPYLLERPKVTILWMEPFPFLILEAFRKFDFSDSFLSGKLVLITGEHLEDQLSEAVKGKGTHPISFVPHRGSWQWKEPEYVRLKHIAEQMFHKKDVNLATLTRFEKIWAKNICYNIPELSKFRPVSDLFGIAKGIKIVIACAGPSLSESIPELSKYRNQFLLLAVDTAVPILTSFGVDPDLIYSVDPQALNSQYLEDYNGDGILIFDPTSTYISLRLDKGPNKGFVTSSPFPLIQLLEKTSSGEIGSVPFGGSVSTNAASLGTLMGAEKVYLVGQDLSFTKGLAHSKGAVLEERLNYLESRKFRREKHNYKQLFALPQKQVLGNANETYITNEKMLIFKKWFEDHSKENPWTNLTKFGAKLEGLEYSDFETEFSNLSDESKKQKDLVKMTKDLIQSKLTVNPSFFDQTLLAKDLQNTITSLNEFVILVKQGLTTSQRIYNQIEKNQINPKTFSEDIKQMDKIDEEVSQKKGLNEILSLGIQRVILTITEGYDEHLCLEEKENPRLGVAKKSLLLYEGLFESVRSTKRMLTKSLYRLLSNL
ncbi:PF01973 family protein [Leptospira yanagawae serovar Saopaulo str. Sao Paulo = ATCC 700523]|uniref:PF01973 family protein n=1 Tax=Leptospira yanagawae serovar Saopaulo str. Sao Paulo = ATCC 700523 TaxID=1249483 RepID=A0A5E8HFJ4_9LEPT|nr:6-hydroxymethylpterin diphosphokinase MptE-like protein [Leptospira yanagawae]EOQ90034.1 PF01973 family protein [Leptospira yanagawae serovar Saopaulo str. Sao Paulo = ATCC 700523]